MTATEETPALLMQWRRNSEGDLRLWIHDRAGWTHYLSHPFYKPDIETFSGFATAQRLLKCGYSYIPTTDKGDLT